MYVPIGVYATSIPRLVILGNINCHYKILRNLRITYDFMRQNFLVQDELSGLVANVSMYAVYGQPAPAQQDDQNIKTIMIGVSARTQCYHWYTRERHSTECENMRGKGRKSRDLRGGGGLRAWDWHYTDWLTQHTRRDCDRTSATKPQSRAACERRGETCRHSQTAPDCNGGTDGTWTCSCSWQGFNVGSWERLIFVAPPWRWSGGYARPN